MQTSWYLSPDGSLDMDKLLQAFQQFYRRHAEGWLNRFEYKESGHQLLLMAFLPRVVNGGGRLEREMVPRLREQRAYRSGRVNEMYTEMPITVVEM